MHASATGPSTSAGAGPEPASFASAARAVWRPFLITRLLVLLGGYLAAAVIGFDPLPCETAAWRVSDGVLANLPARWDAYWYLDIATRGYDPTPNHLAESNVVFFPAYPLLLRAASPLSPLSPLWTGVVLSHLAFFLALTSVYRLAVADLDEDRARYTVWLLCAWPFALYFGAAYTESLFLLLLATTFLALRQGRLGRSAALGVVLGLTRPNGYFVTLPLGWLLLRRPLSARKLAVVLAPVLGAALFSAYMARLSGEPLLWMKAQVGWGFLPADLLGVELPAKDEGIDYPDRISDPIIDVANAAAGLLALGAAIPVLRRFGAPYALLLASLVPPALAHGTTSLGRFTSVLFPLHFWLAVAIPERDRRTALAAALAFQLLAAGAFYTWRFMF